ncbi:MAG: hypothetical protein JST08_11540 [Actinobacteria bacterium]|nr:hypothetical protein [Actinomycetota bacterium]
MTTHTQEQTHLPKLLPHRRSLVRLLLACGLTMAIALSAAAGASAAVRSLVLPKQVPARGAALSVLVANPNGFDAKATLELRLEKKRLARTSLTVPAHGRQSIRIELDRSTRTTLAGAKAPRLSAVASFRDPSGRLRRATSTIAVTGVQGGRGDDGTPSPGAPKGPSAPPPTPGPSAGPDGTYHGAGGLSVVISGGKVTSFNGQITTYCAMSETQKNVSFGMYGEDPSPQVGADGSFAWEATNGYGFVKLKFEGRVSGGNAAGNLVVEDRSPLLTGEGRLEFDYCFAGTEWTATR